MPSLGLQYGFLRPYWGRDFGESRAQRTRRARPSPPSFLFV
jgi:hypothetical protein